MPKNITDNQFKVKIRELLREGTRKNAVRDLEIAREWEGDFFEEFKRNNNEKTILGIQC